VDRAAAVVVPEIEVEVRGEMALGWVGYARMTVLAVVGDAQEPVLSARVRLTQGRDPAVRCSAVVRASLDVNGQPIRGRATAESMHEAIDMLRGRLEYQLARLEHWRLGPGSIPGFPPRWHRPGQSTPGR
jgi:hypothetical protein